MPALRSSGLSLANKCQLLFGLAVILILTAALSVPWIRMQRIVDEGEFEMAAEIAQAWIASHVGDGGGVPSTEWSQAPIEGATEGQRVARSSLRVSFLRMDDALAQRDERPLIGQALEVLQTQHEYRYVDREQDNARRYQYVRAVRFGDLGIDDAEPDAMVGIVVVDRDARSAVRAIFINRFYILLSGVLAGMLAVAVFYVITMRIILSPVRVLRETAERVSKGELNIRSDIRTGDEFEELSETFNLMLSNLKTSQDQLRQLNKTLDLQLNELAASNTNLATSNRLKSEFLANVSHELRTPLNSILGFTEVIQGLDDGSAESNSNAAQERRRRYLENIVVSGRSLLNLINDLLDLAKIEAGRLEITPEPTDIGEVCRSLVTLIGQQAEKREIDLVCEVAETLPSVETDPGRFQQIVYNFLSNAVKFTPPHGRITLRAARARSSDEGGERIRVSVTDTGPGISEDDQAIIFEKFRQVDASHTRLHSGTGLGLAICNDLAGLLGGRIWVESTLGEGSTFYLELPVELPRQTPAALMPESEAGVSESP